MATRLEKVREKSAALAHKGKHDKALELWRDACKKEPFDPDLWIGRGEAALTLALRDEALEAFFRAADMFTRGGFMKEGLSACQRVLAVDARHGGARRLAQMLRSRLGLDDDDDEVGRAPVRPSATADADDDDEEAATAAKPEVAAPRPTPTPTPTRAPAPAREVPSLPVGQRGRTTSSVELSLTAEPGPEAESEPEVVASRPAPPREVPSLPAGQRGRTSSSVELSLTAEPAGDEEMDNASVGDITRAVQQAAERVARSTPIATQAARPSGQQAAVAPPPVATAPATPAAPAAAASAQSAAIPPATPAPSRSGPMAAVPQPVAAGSSGPTSSPHSGPVPIVVQSDLAARRLTTVERAVPSEPGLEHITLADALPFTELHTPAESEGSGPIADAAKSVRELSLDEPGKLDVLQVVAASVTSSPLLAELDSDLVKRLIDQGELRHRKKTQTIFKQGMIGTSLFLILRGEVSVVREPDQTTTASGSHVPPIELARLRAGAFFGEMALLTNRPRSATVIAETDVDLLEVSRQHVRDLVASEGRVLRLLMRFFRARMVNTLLATSPLFKPFSREDRRQLVGRFRLREVTAARDVIKEGGRSDGLYLVLTGKLQAVRGSKEVLGELGPGDVFGEMSLLQKNPAVASIRTVSKAWLLVLPREDFNEVLSTHPQLLEQLSEVADQRRRRNDEHGGVGAERLDPV